MNLWKKNQAAKSFDKQGEIDRIFFPEEPAAVDQKVRRISLPVSLPKCLFGFKEKTSDEKGRALLEKELCTKLVLDLLFGQSSEIYQKLYDEKLIFDNFGSEYNSNEGYSFSIIGGDTPDPEALLARVKEETARIAQQGFQDEDFKRTRKKKIGGFLRMLNSPEAIANQFTNYQFKGIDFFDILPVYESLSLEQVNRRFREHFDWEQSAVSIVKSEAK